jgi:hypothetical protein
VAIDRNKWHDGSYGAHAMYAHKQAKKTGHKAWRRLRTYWLGCCSPGEHELLKIKMGLRVEEGIA